MAFLATVLAGFFLLVLLAIKYDSIIPKINAVASDITNFIRSKFGPNLGRLANFLAEWDESYSRHITCFLHGIAAAFIVTLVSIFSLKIGFRKFYTYLSPISWAELINQAHGFILLFLIVFFAVFFWQLRFYRKKTCLFCLTCKKVVDSHVANNQRCPNCGESAEPLEGIYERHPELRND